MRALREDRGMSLSRLSFASATDDTVEERYTASFLSKVENGHKPAPEPMLILYGALFQPTPDELPEYHLAHARRMLDEKVVGLGQAVANLRELEAAASGPEGLPAPPADGFLGQLLRAGQTTPADRDEGASRPAVNRRRRSSRRKAS